MADFTALKTAIQNAIKQNGNEEITGNLLQEVLLAIVTTLGDGSINDLITALGSEATTRGNADTALQGLIDGITDNIENGYVYAGIATPSSTPVTGKVFYLALTAGTYTNFDRTDVFQGINILKYNGSAWSLDVFIGIDDEPTAGSNNLVKSFGIKNYVDNRVIVSQDTSTEHININVGGNTTQVASAVEIDGNKETYTHTFEQEAAYLDYGEFQEPLPVGSYINRIVTGNGDSVVWLCGQSGTSVKQLTGETLPFITDQIYYGIRNNLNDTVKLYISVSGAPQNGINPRLDDLEDRADSIESDVADLSDEVRGNSKTFTHTFVNQSASFIEFAPFPHKLPVGTHINELIATPVGDVWLCVEHVATTKISEQTLPYITDREYDGIVYEKLNGTVSINYSASERIVGVEERVDDLEENVDSLEGKVDSLDLYVKGNTEDFIHTFNQQVSWDEYAPFPSKIPAGTYITELHTKFNSVVWLCGEYTTSVKNLTDQTLPFVTDADYYGIRISNLKDTIELTFCDSSVVIEGLKDRVKKLEQEIIPSARECVHIYKTDTQFQLFQKMHYAFTKGKCDVFFEKATYTLDEVYHDIVAAQGTWAVGLPIGNDCRYYMNGSTIISNEPSTPTGSDTRNVLDCQVSGQNFEIYDAILINNGGVYCVHDEGNASPIPYIHKYQNVQMFYHETEDTPGAGCKPFGCGTGFDSTLIFNNCLFKTDLVNGVCFAIHGINQQDPAPCVFRLNMTNSCIYTGTMYMNLFDATRDTIEYYLANNKWGEDFDVTNSTFAVKFNNVV